MKIIGAALAALCLLLVSCKKEAPTNQTDTATTSTRVTATPKTDTAARGSSTTSRFTAATELTVHFTGMIVFVLSNGVERAVPLRVSGHKLEIAFPKDMETEFEKVFKPRKCGIECVLPFDNQAFRIVDASNTPLTAPFDPSSTFKSTVTHLTKVPLPASAADTFKVGNIKSDVFAKPKKSTLMGGFFELAGGKGEVTPFTCKAHFGTDMSTSQSFPRLVTVKFALPSDAKLQVNQGGAGWVDLVTLTKLPSPLSFTVDNNMKTKVSHFDNYALLSKKKVNLPDVNLDDKDCVEASGDVPGCSDSQWP